MSDVLAHSEDTAYASKPNILRPGDKPGTPEEVVAAANERLADANLPVTLAPDSVVENDEVHPATLEAAAEAPAEVEEPAPAEPEQPQE
jgi:hypothetical protein